MKIAVIDYGLGNMRSVEQALAHLGAQAQLTSAPADLEAADALVLPGDGAFGDGMKGLAGHGLVEPIRALAKTKPLLGICLGLQMFFESSEESPGAVGLGLLKGCSKRFSGPAFGAAGGLKVPHMGWNRLSMARPHPVFEGVADGSHVYFVHSYYVAPADEADVIARSDYGGPFCAVAGRERFVGCQYHPEKSQRAGIRMLRNFLDWAGR